MESKQELSVWLAGILDEFGYSEKRVQERVWMNDRVALAKTISTQEITGDRHIEKFPVGSTREGITLHYESDFDWMQINKRVLCTDEIVNTRGDKHGKDLVRIVTRNAPSGYTFLQYNKNDNYGRVASRTVRNALVETPSGYYLSSNRYMSFKNEDVFYNSTGYISRNTVYMEKKGPSIPKYINQNSRLLKWFLGDVKLNSTIDFVRGFECHYPTLSKAWANRKRPHNWPSKELITELADLPIHVVPVGVSGSPDEDLQWRFSFTLAEIALVRSFNETQRKMLIVLRHISKYLIEPIAPDMSSYIMKNVAFWISERTVTSKFSINELVDRVLDALDFLRDSVEGGTLQHFFIQERNLFRGKFHGNQKKLLMQKLKDIRLNGTKILCRVLQSKDIEQIFPVAWNILLNKCWLNNFDKVYTLQLFSLLQSGLARHFTHSYYCKYHIMAIIRDLPWLFLVFGTKWLTDPFSCDITNEAYTPKNERYLQRAIRGKPANEGLVTEEPRGWIMNIILQVLAKVEKVAIFFLVFYVVLFSGMYLYCSLKCSHNLNL